jgi:hypothetical protein
MVDMYKYNIYDRLNEFKSIDANADKINYLNDIINGIEPSNKYNNPKRLFIFIILQILHSSDDIVNKLFKLFYYGRNGVTNTSQQNIQKMNSAKSKINTHIIHISDMNYELPHMNDELPHMNDEFFFYKTMMFLSGTSSQQQMKRLSIFKDDDNFKKKYPNMSYILNSDNQFIPMRELLLKKIEDNYNKKMDGIIAYKKAMKATKATKEKKVTEKEADEAEADEAEADKAEADEAEADKAEADKAEAKADILKKRDNYNKKIDDSMNYYNNITIRNIFTDTDLLVKLINILNHIITDFNILYEYYKFAVENNDQDPDMVGFKLIKEISNKIDILTGQDDHRNTVLSKYLIGDIQMSNQLITNNEHKGNIENIKKIIIKLESLSSATYNDDWVSFDETQYKCKTHDGKLTNPNDYYYFKKTPGNDKLESLLVDEIMGYVSGYKQPDKICHLTKSYGGSQYHAKYIQQKKQYIDLKNKLTKQP